MEGKQKPGQSGCLAMAADEGQNDSANEVGI